MKRRVQVVTGSRAEFGLLDPVMRAIARHPDLELLTAAAGAHLLKPAETWRDIERAGFRVDARVEMQTQATPSRLHDAAAAGRGVATLAGVIGELKPAWVVVLGDRIEAFAAAAAAAIGGVAVAHLHGGDRAEGIADESLRHAITKLAHLHLPATRASADRIVRMGERPEFVRVIGSPAIDDLASIEAMSDAEAQELGDPAAVFLMHPSGLDERAERELASAGLRAAAAAFPGRGIACFSPNHDPGRQVIAEEIESFARGGVGRMIDHLPRRRFVGLLKRLAARGGIMVGNSSAGLIEATALRLPAVNIGPRQGGRESPDNTVHAPEASGVAGAIAAALRLDRRSLEHPYGDGKAGERAAAALSAIDPGSAALLRKRCAY